MPVQAIRGMASGHMSGISLVHGAALGYGVSSQFRIANLPMDVTDLSARGPSTPAQKRLISVVIPVYNEEANVRTAYDAVIAVFTTIADRYDFEIIFTDNHSTDRTFSRVTEIAKLDPRVRCVRFARNFGFHRSVMTGYRLARGDAAIQLDCDLQDPPHLFPKFLALWERGHDVVVGIRRKRNEGRLLQGARKLYYRLLKEISSDNLMLDSGDFRLIDRSILDQLRRIDDAAPYTRGLTSLLAASQVGVPYDRSVREQGASKFPVAKLFALAVDGFIAHSTIPLRIASFAGMAIAVITTLASVFYLVMQLFFGVNSPRGFTTTTVLILFGISLNAIFLGIIGEYIGRIYDQIRIRPTAVIEQLVNMTSDADEPGDLKYSGPGQRSTSTRTSTQTARSS
jgi:glycosyltransferase involved in cell wall biosynthesis